MGYPKMEKLPMAAKSSDRTGEKKVSVPKEDRERFVPGASGEKIPNGALSSDTSGERKRPIEGGVGMGKMDGIGSRDSSHMGKHDGRMGEMKGGTSEKNCYEHERSEYR